MKKINYLIATLALTLCLTANAVAQNTINLSTTNTSLAGQWTVASNVFTILDGANVTITGTSGTNERRIAIAANATVNITLDGATITTLIASNPAILLNNNSNVTLTLVGTNTLRGGQSRAAIHVPVGTTLTISDESTGNLTATGGSSSAGIGGSNVDGARDGGIITIHSGTITATGSTAAGIGGGNGGAGGTVTINGGTVTATSSTAAGIGGGYDGAGGTVTITGGVVTATGGSHGAGIGGGFQSAGGNVTINGGTVTATSSGTGQGIGRGDGTADPGTLTVEDAVVFTSSVGDPSPSIENSLLFVGGIATVQGTVQIPFSFTISTGNTLLVPTGATLNVANGTTLTNNGLVLLDDGGTINRNAPPTYGNWLGNDPLSTVGLNIINLSDGSPPANGPGWTFSSNTYTIQSNANVIIIGSSEGSPRRIQAAISATDVNITLANATITSPGAPVPVAFSISSASVALTLVGTNTLASGTNMAGIQITTGTLIIDGTGSLIARGGSSAAGIGGGSSGAGGTVTINGGVVTARGGSSGAGIGGGSSGAGGTVTINGGVVTAISGGGAQGIGRGGGTNLSLNMGTLSVKDAVVFTNSVGDPNPSIENSLLFFDNVTTLQNIVEIPFSFTIPEGNTLFVPTGATLNVANGTTLTNNGTVVSCGTINSGGSFGTWAGTAPISGNPSNTINLSTATPQTHSCDGSWIFADNIYTIYSNANVTVTGTTGTSNRRIEVAANATNVSIRLQSATITAGSTQSAILLNNNSNVTLTLVGINTLTGATNGGAGIRVSAGATLTISEESTGSLTAAGAVPSGSAGIHFNGAGGTVTINGGTVTARGLGTGAGIGGSSGGAGGAVTITGGVVTATSNGTGQGIGGGGTATAANQGTFTMSGNAVVFTNSVGDTTESRRTGGILFIGPTTSAAGVVYGSTTIPNNLTVPTGNTLLVPEGSTLTVPSGRTLTNNGTMTDRGTIVMNGNFSGNRVLFDPNTGGQHSDTTYGETIDISELFDINPRAGTRIYTIETGSTGEGTFDGNNLIVTKVGEFTIGLATNQTNVHAAGTKVTSTLTVEPLAVTIIPDADQSKVFGQADPATLTYTTYPTPLPTSWNAENVVLTREQGEHVGLFEIKLAENTSGNNYNVSLSTTPVNFTIEQAVVLEILDQIKDTTFTAYQAKNAETIEQIIAFADLPTSVEVDTDAEVLQTLPIVWATEVDHNIKGTTYTFTGTPTGNTNIANGGITIDDVKVTVTPITVENPTFYETHVIVVNGVTAATADDLGTYVLPTSGSIYIPNTYTYPETVRVYYTINWGPQTLNRTYENHIEFLGSIEYTNPPEWLTLPTSPQVTRKVSVVAKTDVTNLITFENGSATYTGTELIFESAELLESADIGENPTWLYTYEIANTCPTATLGYNDKPLTAGIYTVTVTYEDTKNLGTKTATFTINKAPLTLTAESKQIEIGDPEPTHTFTLTGLVGQDIGAANTDIITTQPNFALDRPFDNTKPGTFTITPSGAIAANYNITHAPGTLTVICVTHDFSIRDTTTHATCTTAGEGHFLCSICNAQGDTFNPPTLGHNLGNWITTAATCITPGDSTRTCQRANCDHQEKDIIPALGHNLGEWIVTPATCTTAGDSTRTCQRANCTHYEKNVIAQLECCEHCGKEDCDGTCQISSIVGAYCIRPIQVYPNPVTTGNLIVQINDGLTGETIQIYDLSGKLVLTQPATHPKTQINVSHLQKGIYIIKFATTTTRIVIQ